MIGLAAILVLTALLALACWAFVRTYRAKRRQGKSDLQSFAWAIGAVLILSLPITWEAIPTWLAFEYYARKEAGVKIFKTIARWEVENPGVAQTLQPYGFADKRATVQKLSASKSRVLLNERFAYDATSGEKVFLSVHLIKYEVIDVKTEEVLVRYIEVASGNSGGFASGGEGWWAPWLIRRSETKGYQAYSEYREAARIIGVRK